MDEKTIAAIEHIESMVSELLSLVLLMGLFIGAFATIKTDEKPGKDKKDN